MNNYETMACWTDPPDPELLEDCPFCLAHSVAQRIADQIENTLYDAGVSAKAIRETLDSEDMQMALEYCHDDVYLANQRGGGRYICKMHQNG